MGGLRKTMSKVHRVVGRFADPAAYHYSKKKGKDSPWEKSSDDIEGFTAKHIWGGPIDPEDPNADTPLPKVTEMPDDQTTAKSRKRSQSRRQAASGRSSTILSDGLGG